jgi:hypothetical protein
LVIGVEALGFSGAAVLTPLFWQNFAGILVLAQRLASAACRFFVLALQRPAFGFIAGLSMYHGGDVVLMMSDRGRLVLGFCWFVPKADLQSVSLFKYEAVIHGDA